ncbi:methyltransferase domain-containing protein [Streptomyces sp. AcE210]|uniref:bifunctional class I SAM-dependent methyltransferase/NUDIX hydrolase n=1 Tax=Streptomyces sp. AcE210 TaxID=2292703 RepID=UPI001F0C1F41|nr:methyltransferase domain-containing protein [Streptomyces sp. AcE210]
MFTTQDQWDRGYADGRRYRPLSDGERSLLAAHAPTPVGGRALDVGCGVGELAAHLSTLGYAVDAIDWSATALAEATARHGRTIRWHYLHPGPRWPLGKIGFIFDGGRLTSEQLHRIRLDPAEHDMWATHDLDQWRRLMGEMPFARLNAIEQARHGQGPNYLVTGP